MKDNGQRRICLVHGKACHNFSETFIQAHTDLLPAAVTVVHGTSPVTVNDRPARSRSLAARGIRKAARLGRRRPIGWERTCEFRAAFRQARAQAVLAEYGPTGCDVLEACRLEGLPLVVHFHGYDASRESILAVYRAAYENLFRHAAAIVAVSRAMQERLVEMGAPRAKVFCNPCGVDCHAFSPANPASNPPTFASVGRFVEKKGPHLTLLAFCQARREVPQMRLKMVGDGPLLGVCRDFARALGVADAVEFLGVLPHAAVASQLQQVRGFVQHSVVASDGDSEGTPVAVLEASASGLPVVSTRHAGIPDVVIDGHTGLLVEERDVQGMANNLIRLAQDPDLAEKLGKAARHRVGSKYSMEQSISRLWSIVASSMKGAGSEFHQAAEMQAPEVRRANGVEVA